MQTPPMLLGFLPAIAATGTWRSPTTQATSRLVRRWRRRGAQHENSLNTDVGACGRAFSSWVYRASATHSFFRRRREGEIGMWSLNSRRQARNAGRLPNRNEQQEEI
ncbi:hypothetical protein C8R47DRAFT_1106543 [Mycena vitilis]|nr:hypothetical protein C8R47DRAFT_1106543 [Mycena vitilis]